MSHIPNEESMIFLKALESCLKHIFIDQRTVFLYTLPPEPLEVIKFLF